jgi:hypothetical protein
VAELQKLTTGGTRLTIFGIAAAHVTTIADFEKSIIALYPVHLLPGSVQPILGDIPEMPSPHWIAVHTDPSKYSENHIRGLGPPVAGFADAVFGTDGIGEILIALYSKQRLEITKTYHIIIDILRSAAEIAETCYNFTKNPSGGSQAIVERAKVLFSQGLANISTIVTEPANALLMIIVDPPGTAPKNMATLFPAKVIAADPIHIPRLVLGQGPQIKETPIEAPTMLNDEQKLINYAVPPVAVYSLVQTADAVPVGSHTDFVIESGTRETLERMKFPSGGRQLYGLVIDKPGDMVALYKAVAINIGLNPPPDIKSKSADRTKGASGWLYDIVRAADSDIHALRLRTYIKSSEYAVST